ncbi:hypothetical protein ACFZAG_29125 [Streptomyces sp. NPDC012403]|uniref:hypothetical protein n=1 Tax=Streptomyces sp. NPDC012403 TaxID=3364831 RepID=UPI0036E36EA5
MSAPLASYTVAVDRYLTGAGIAKSSARIYRISLTTWGWMLVGELAPTGPARRGAKPPLLPIAAIDNPALPVGPLASPDDIDDLDGWTLHRLRHSALTHDAEDGTSTPMLPARSLERYARPGVDAVARHVAGRTPAARRRTRPRRPPPDAPPPPAAGRAPAVCGR